MNQPNANSTEGNKYTTYYDGSLASLLEDSLSIASKDKVLRRP